ncbi:MULTISPECIES: cytochrome c biogenesis CcdA family protein [Cyclobacteriaceae]|jgi:cytochrome c-type biogenesis protein|uniref:Thiol:disulfide interchange protein n=2 Tax=Cyclobacteriaceae TaxID=563798 RepID=I3Z804_BELBD|nr:MULTISPECIES: cytochrome c biogenesis protein CcdA [Cyclobacteriaceae]MBX2913319.1 sulfite exporter TauE/SafE family protein [Cyclobacteriaceae bacterium]MCB0538441.1 sulfite exporter TauE/SafE family protein [Bacteroidota bacterium]AFL85372.1 thiol:disulfide interchange protein [Belliella baltica DSM 15883]MCB0495940.1 sulfite exporter TauE/SafE family protein [Cyclobacteriaceae bacterium]MCW5903019.1 sulfite exporter TauE/SafE family protein [Cyclobacteriaceae bacterium]|tara:strand:- start:319 stop:1008 length:690 start_codon:yes stop_codon:yes gene_type:complete
MTLESFFENFGGDLSEVSLLSFTIAFLAGIVSSGVCPCTLPVGLGMAGLVSSNSEKRASYGFLIAGAFFFGIVLSLTLLGALAGRFGVILSETFGLYWALAMVIISIIAAIAAFYGPRLNVTKLASIRKPGIGGSVLYGFIFSLGTSAAPLLLLLSVAAATADPFYGLTLAFSFGLGRGLPFLLVGLFAGAVSRLAQLTWLRRSIQIISGSALLFVAFYYGRVFIELMP